MQKRASLFGKLIHSSGHLRATSAPRHSDLPQQQTPEGLSGVQEPRKGGGKEVEEIFAAEFNRFIPRKKKVG